MTQITLHKPFVISARLAPALRIGDAWLSLLGTGWSPNGASPLGRRQCATLVLDFPDGTSYEDDRMQSGCGGFGGHVAIFETFLSFLLAAVESYEYEQRHPGSEGENTSLFPRHIVEWAAEHQGDVEGMHSWISTECGDANETLIKEAA